MASHAQSDRIRGVVAPVVGAAGLFLEDVVVMPAGGRSVVRIVVDLDDDAVGGLDLDTLAEVSTEVSAALDAANVVAGAYALEVSSPGTDRPLTELRHFRRARGRLVELRLTDGTAVTGRLREAEPDGLVIDVPTGVKGRPGAPVERAVALDQVTRGTVQVELARAAQVDLGDDDEQDGLALDAAGEQEQG